MKNKIKEKRSELKITQQELAYIIGISLSSLANIENNRCIPNVETSIKIAYNLHCIVEEIFIITEKE